MKIWQQLLLLLLLLFLGGCQGAKREQKRLREWMAEDGRIKALATTAMVGELVRQVGGERVDLLVLVGEESDPHSYQLVKGDGEKLERADLIFYNGLQLEHGPSLVAALQDNPKAISLGNLLLEQSPDRFLYVAGQLDPHIWMDISLWNQTVPFVVQSLTHLDPAHHLFYQANGERLQKQLTAAHEEVYQLLQTLPPRLRYLVTSHDAFNYFGRAYLATPEELRTNQWHQRIAAPEGLAPESQLSTVDIARILDHLETFHIRVLFTESNVSKDSIRKIIDAGRQRGLPLQIAAEPLYGDAMGPPGSNANSYPQMIQSNSQLIYRYLSSGAAKALCADPSPKDPL